MSRLAASVCPVLFLMVFGLTSLTRCHQASAITPIALATQEQTKDDERPDLTEQSIYIPYDKLKSVFEEKGRGVFIPYEDFQKLWEAARKNTHRTKPPTAPLGALITDIQSVATLGKEIVAVDAEIKIELIKQGWHRIPLRLKDAAIRSASVDDEDAKIVTRDGQYELLIEHQGEAAKTLTLKLSYAKSLTKSGAQSNVSFSAPQAPVNQWTIRTGESDVDVQIEPMIATSEQPKANPEDDKEILAFVGTAPQVKLTWTPKAEGAAGLDALISSSVQSRVRINSGVVRTTANVGLDISRSEIRTLSIDVPADQKVVSIFDRNIKKWNVEKLTDVQRIEIDLFEPAIGKQAVVVELETFIEDINQATVTAPQISVVDSSRSSGILLVQVGEGLRIEPKTKDGLLQLDQTEIASRTSEKWNLGFRYSTLPHTLTLGIDKIEPQIEVTQLLEYAIRPRRIEANLSAMFDIQEAGVFQVRFQVPETFKIKDIQPLASKGTKPVPVESFYRDKDNAETVIVTLQRKALGKIALIAYLEQTSDEINLDSPTDDATKISLTLPKTKLDSVKFSQGNFVVYAPESLRLNSSATKGLRKTGFERVYETHGRFVAQDVRPVLAYSFSHNDASIELQARRRKPQVNVEQIVSVAIKTGVAKFDSSFFYDVRYSGVKELRLDVPEELVDTLRLTTDGIQQQTFEPQPDDVANSYVALKLTGENEFFGGNTIHFEWQREIKNLTLGESVDVSVAQLKPANVDRSTGKIVLTKSETIDVRPTDSASGLRPIDPQTDVGSRVKIVDASMAFEYSGDWNLDLKASRFELQELKQTSISRALVRAVVLRQDELSVQCLYKIRSVRQRIAIRMPNGFDPETSFDDQPVRINNVAVTPERGGNDVIFVPLVGQQSDQPFLLELRYNISGNANEIELPEFTEDPAVQKCYLAVYVPFEKALVNTNGNWTDEEIGDNHSSLLGALNPESSVWNRLFRPRSSMGDQYLNWVTEGMSVPANNRGFEVDGRAYVFSSIRPAAGPAGGLRLTTMSLWIINLLVCGLILIIGLALVRTKLSIQIAFGLLVVGGLLLLGVLAPLFTEHLFGPAFVGTVFVVGIAWAASNLNRLRLAYLRSATERADALAERPLANATDLRPEPAAATEEESPPGDADLVSDSDSDQGGDA